MSSCYVIVHFALNGLEGFVKKAKPEGDVNELSGRLLDALIAAHELSLDGLPVWRIGLLKQRELQVFSWLHHCLYTLDDQVNALCGMTFSLQSNVHKQLFHGRFQCRSMHQTTVFCC